MSGGTVTFDAINNPSEEGACLWQHSVQSVPNQRQHCCIRTHGTWHKRPSPVHVNAMDVKPLLVDALCSMPNTMPVAFAKLHVVA